MNPSRVTMAMVAKQAGVHTTSVSLALRNHPSLPLSTRKRLRELAAQMGYRRDPALSALLSYRRHNHPNKTNPSLAYVTHWDTQWGWKASPAHLAFFEGATAKSAELGFQLEHFWLGETGVTHQRMSRILYSRGIKGLVIASHRLEYSDPLDFDWSRFSGVKIDFFPLKQRLHIVSNDQRTIVGLAMQQARAAGYRRIGFLMNQWWDDYCDHAWSAGFLAEQQSIAPAVRIPILFFSPPLQSERGSIANREDLVPRELLAKWLREYQPEVIISHGPFVLPRLDELGLSVPRDISFVEVLLQNPDGCVAGVRQNCHRVGELAVEILVGQLHQHVYGIPAIPTATLVEGTWFEGRSLLPRLPHPVAAAPLPAKPSRPGQRKALFPSRTRRHAPTRSPQAEAAAS